MFRTYYSSTHISSGYNIVKTVIIHSPLEKKNEIILFHEIILGSRQNHSIQIEVDLSTPDFSHVPDALWKTPLFTKYIAKDVLSPKVPETDAGVAVGANFRFEQHVLTKAVTRVEKIMQIPDRNEKTPASRR
ncbi:hypothetical protein JTB14_013330 [Gonioctena quinquepunctata]|nr:hypothetical protein JTB14_013330 [Gonioctena quinquepunctata]